MADGLRRREHIATQWHRVGGGSVLRCHCGEWESDPSDTAMVQREAHRSHRREKGEHVAPRRPSVAERLEAAEAVNERAKALHSRDDSNPLGPWCGTCTTAWPCATWTTLDQPADGEQGREREAITPARSPLVIIPLPLGDGGSAVLDAVAWEYRPALTKAHMVQESTPWGDALVIYEPTADGEQTPRRNVHCSRCGDTRGGPFGHETTECTWRRSG